MVDINLGLDHDEDTLAPMLSYETDQNLRVQNISCGGNHTVMLLSDGSLLGCGDNSSGQLLNIEEGMHLVGWKKMETPGRIVSCTACWESTIVVTEEGRVYSRGSGLKGELGLGESLLEAKTGFQLVMDTSEFANPRLVSSFQNCILIVDKQNVSGSLVYGWGNNTKCQLSEPKSRRISTPRQLFDGPLISDVSMGKDFLIMMDSSNMIVKQQGHLPEEFIKSYNTLWRNQTGLQIKSMWKSVHIMRHEQCMNLYSYGNNIHGQLFPGVGTTGITEIEKYTTGSEHGILYAKCGLDHKIFCWGWGEHGNCGSLKGRKRGWKNDKSNVSSPLNPILVLGSNSIHTTIEIFGGCASTWIISNAPIL